MVRSGESAVKLTLATIALAALVELSACSSTPEIQGPTTVRASNDTAAKAIVYAKEMLGKPYRSAGESPDGFLR